MDINKRDVRIVECIDEDDPGFEERVLKELFNLMEVESKLVRVEAQPVLTGRGPYLPRWAS